MEVVDIWNISIEITPQKLDLLYCLSALTWFQTKRFYNSLHILQWYMNCAVCKILLNSSIWFLIRKTQTLHEILNFIELITEAK